MPGFGEKFSKFVNDTKKGAQDMVETNKLNSAVHKEESAIESVYARIGKSYFEAYRDDQNIPANFRQMLDEVLTHMQEIDQLKEKLVDVRGNKRCPGCGAEVDNEKMFCGNCGYRFDAKEAEAAQETAYQPTSYEYQSAPVQSEPESQPVQGTWPPSSAGAQVQEQAKSRFCTGCGTQVPEGSAFCGNCGQRI